MNEKIDVEKILSAIDQIAEATGTQKISSIVNSFVSSIPSEAQAVVIAQVKEATAKAIAEGLDKTKAGLESVLDNKELIDKLKSMGPKGD